MPSPVVIKFPPHTKTQTSGHSKFSQSKSLSGLSHPLPKTRHAGNIGRRAYHTSSSSKFHLCFPKKIHKVTETCFTISTAGPRMNNLFVSAQLIYLLSPAADRLFYPLLPPMTSKHQCCRICDNKTGVVYPQGENKTLAEHRTPFPLLFKYKDLQATLFIDQDNTSSHSESGATRRTATGNRMIK